MRKLIVIVFTFFLLSSGMMTAVGIDAIEWNEKTNQIAENVQEIKDWHDLDEIRDDLDKGYLLMDNLDEDTEGYDELVDSVNGWNPINDFTGSFDGNGHKIFDLYVNRPNTDYVGLFGYTDDAELSDVGLIDVDINGDNYIGTLVGDKRGGTISRSYTTGDVSGDEYVGGLVGHNTGTVSNSYTLANVNGDWRIGGLTGWNFLESTVENSYAAGEVNGESEAGSIVGYNTGTISDSFSLDSPLIGEDGGSRQGRVAEADESEMKDYPLYTQVSYSDYDDLEEPWDFVGDPNDDEGDKDIWDIDEDEEINDGYPFLTWEDEEEIPDEYELIVYIEGEGSVEVDGQEIYDGWTGEFGDEEVELVADADEGWAFDGWTGTDKTGEEITIKMDEDKQITAHFTDVDEIPDLFLEDYSFTNSAPSTLHRILEFIDLYDLQLIGEFEVEFSDPDMIDSAELELELEYFKPIEDGWESPRETYHETQYFNLERVGDYWGADIEVGSWYPGEPMSILASLFKEKIWLSDFYEGPLVGVEQVYTSAEITEIDVVTVDGQMEVIAVDESVKTSHEKAWEAYMDHIYETGILASPATIIVETEMGRLGSDGEDTYEEIEGYYSGSELEVQFFVFPTSVEDYEVKIYGTDEGEYNLQLVRLRKGDYEEIITKENEEIHEGEEKNWEIDTPDDLEDEDEMDWVPYMGIGIIALIVLVIAVILIKKRGKSKPSQKEEYYESQSPSRELSDQGLERSKGPPAQEGRKQNLCPDCGGKMRYIEEYESWYCDNCQEYK